MFSQVETPFLILILYLSNPVYIKVFMRPSLITSNVTSKILNQVLTFPVIKTEHKNKTIILKSGKYLWEWLRCEIMKPNDICHSSTRS